MSIHPIWLELKKHPRWEVSLPPLLWRWWTAAKDLSITVTVALPVQSSASLSILPQVVGRQESTSCPSTSCYSGPFYMPMWGESDGAGERWRGGRKREGTTLGTPFPSDPSPYYHADYKSKTKQQQRLISFGFALWCLVCLLEGSLHRLDNLHTLLSATHFYN